MTTIYILICEFCGNVTQTFHHQREFYGEKSTMTICQRRLYVLLIEIHAHAFVRNNLISRKLIYDRSQFTNLIL